MADYIDREALRTTYTKWRNIQAKIDDDYGYGLMDDVLRELDAQPTADVVPVRHGRWIPIRESEITGWNPEFAGRDPIGGYKCSECGRFAVFDCNDEYVLSDFCPQCGAKMDGGADNEMRLLPVIQPGGCLPGS